MAFAKDREPRPDNTPLVGRRRMRNMVRWRNRKDGNYYDGSPFRGASRDRHLSLEGRLRVIREGVSTELPSNGQGTGSGKPHAAPLQAPSEIVRNSQTTQEKQSRPCQKPGCPRTTTRGTLCNKHFVPIPGMGRKALSSSA